MSRLWWLWLPALVAGFVLGRSSAWMLSSIRHVDAAPNALRADFKDQFRAALASSYSATHNLDRARARLVLLGDPDPVAALSAQAQRMLAAGRSFQLARDLAVLAADLHQAGPGLPLVAAAATSSGAGSAAAQLPSATPAISSTPSVAAAPLLESPTAQVASTQLDLNTPTARPTRTPIETPRAPFQLVGQDNECSTSLTEGLLQIVVFDNHRQQMPGVDITIAWDGGEQHFFTGLKPEIGNGYADYIMERGVTYSLRVAQTGTPISGLTRPSCPDSTAQAYTGGLKLTFQQP